MSNEEAQLLINQVASQLGEHFDAIQIMGTWSEEGICCMVHSGAGNWYARQGMAHEFISEDRAQTIGKEVARQLPEPPEDSKF
jgi:hypothetical protein